jgi:protein-tyrosine kinase
MERIKQALERARAQQPGPELIEEPASLVRPAIPAPPQPQAAGAIEAGIAYTQTQVVELSREHLRRHRVITGDQNDRVTNAYKILRTQVLQRMAVQGWNALAVTSPGHGEGTTLTAVNLAISLSREAHRTVLLVDLNLREPSVHEVLGFSPRYGLSDYFLHDVPLNEVLVNPGIERFVVLPGREPMFNSSELLASPKMVRLVEELKSRYPSRMVIFDLPPLLGTPDALAFSPYTDTVLLVLREGKTTQDDLVNAMTLLESVNVLGTVLNGTLDRG